MKLSMRAASRPVSTVVIAVSCLTLAGFGSIEKQKPADTSAPLTVPKATCGPNDHPETALQGQVTAAMRASGFTGFNCNLELVGQVRGDGANWQTTQFAQGRHKICAYHAPRSPAGNRLVHVSGQWIADAQVHERRMAVPRQRNAAGRAELAVAAPRPRDFACIAEHAACKSAIAAHQWSTVDVIETMRHCPSTCSAVTAPES